MGAKLSADWVKSTRRSGLIKFHIGAGEVSESCASTAIGQRTARVHACHLCVTSDWLTHWPARRCVAMTTEDTAAETNEREMPPR